MESIFSAISILLVFASVILDLLVKDISNFKKINKPNCDQKEHLKKYIKQKNKLIFKIIGCLVFYLVFFYLLLPQSVNIIKTSAFRLWNFNVTNALYILINFTIFIFIIQLFIYLIQIIKK